MSRHYNSKMLASRYMAVTIALLQTDYVSSMLRLRIGILASNTGRELHQQTFLGRKIHNGRQ